MNSMKFAKAQVTAESAFKEINRTISEPKSSYSHLRRLVAYTYRILSTKQEAMDADIAEIKSTYKKEKADAMILEMQKNHDLDVTTFQALLQKELQTVVEAKKAAVQKFTVTPPTAEQMTLIQTLKLRDLTNISAEEWEMYISALSGNYQTARVLEELARSSGREFFAPFHPEDALRKIETIRSRADHTIENISNPNAFTYYDNEFIRIDVEDSATASIIRELDDLAATTTPKPDTSLSDMLDAAKKGCFDLLTDDAVALWRQIVDFRLAHKAELADALKTPKKVREEAEALIASAKKLMKEGK